MTEGSNAIRQNYHEAAGRNRVLNFVLWFTQALLALLFLFAGGSKLVMTMEQMKAGGGGPELPEWFLRFLGVVELLGALGLILPGLFRIRPMLTPLAAAGLVIIMIGATTITIATMSVSAATVPFVAGLLALFVAYGRWKLAPHGDRRRP
jgi:uncharacterized membrane protein YphA (DoxX/SURF4 family)